MAKRKRRRTPVSPAVIAVTAIVLILIVFGIVKLVGKYSPSDEKMDSAEYFNLQSEDDLAVIVENQVLEAKGIVLNGRAYVSTDTVRDYLNDRFYWDSTENVYIYTTPTEMISAEVGSSDYTVAKQKNSVDYQIVKTDGNTAYVALDFVKLYTALDYEFYEEPNRVSITCTYGDKTVVDVKKTAPVRYRAGVKSPILTEAGGDEVLYVLEETEEIDGWTRVGTADGYIGYVQDKRIGAERTITTETEFEAPEYTSLTKDYTINLAWHQVDNTTANDTVLSKIANTKGLTTISPTWFFIKDGDGNLESLATQTYVNYCHQNNIEVWGLVENMKYAAEFDITELLGRTSSRQNLVNQLIAQAIQYDLDGINVDIEALPGTAEQGYIEFIRELSIMCRLNGIILSIDNYVPTASSDHYNREEQGIVADYVIIMGYDEHYAGSEEAGSVASIGFVRDGIEKTLEAVPAEKVINAVPFYTRLWCTSGDEVTSTVKSMDAADQVLRDNEVEKLWADAYGQYYAEFENADGLYQIWLEEETSIEEKAKLIKEYNLAGIASWKLGFERTDIWDIILKYVN